MINSEIIQLISTTFPKLGSENNPTQHLELWDFGDGSNIATGTVNHTL